MMLQVLLILLELCRFWMTNSVRAACLSVPACNCEAGSSGLVVNCRNLGFDRVPAFRADDPDLVYFELTLESNAIVTIDDNAFAGIRIKRLVFTSNNLMLVSDNAFNGLEGDLTELILQFDGSASFPTVAVKRLAKLEYLEVVGYGKDSLPIGSLEPLSGLKSLILRSGRLGVLSPTDLASQRGRLTLLNLQSNDFTDVPSSALSSLKNLSTLQMDSNQIAAVGYDAFAGASNLRTLDLSRNPIQAMDISAFASLATTLTSLALQKCHLDDTYLRAIMPLSYLTRLDISDNSLAAVDDLLTSMKRLQVLLVPRNRITTLRRSTYRSMSSSLRVLHLDDNPLVDVAPDTFAELDQLQELYLDGAAELNIDEGMFASQERTLQLLSLRSNKIKVSPWPAVAKLRSLKTLWMSACGITAIPEFTFRTTNQLENLDLNSNAIAVLSQRSMIGLENSLVRLYLSGNNLTTLDECVFYGFKKLDVLQLQLNNNPLRCDCHLGWLHRRLEPFKSNPATQFRAMSLQWKCADLDNRLFNSLTDADFDDCRATTTPMHCEQTIDTNVSTPFPTFPPTQDPAAGYLVVRLSDVRHDAMLVTWTTQADDVGNFTVVYIIDGHVQHSPTLGFATRQYRVTGLHPSTVYIICVQMGTLYSTATTCTNTSTFESGPGSRPIVLGASLAGGFVVLCLVVAVVVFVCWKRSRSRPESKLVRYPKVGRQSKRYRKTGEHQDPNQEHHQDETTPTTTSHVADTCEDILVHTLETMTDLEKDRLVNLLTHSMDSLSDLDRKTSHRYTGARYGRFDANPPPPPPIFAQFSTKDHVYDEIPDSYYDEISGEDEVKVNLGKDEEEEEEEEKEDIGKRKGGNEPEKETRLR